MNSASVHLPHASLDHLSGKRILVTGGTGFLGSRLVPMLANAGARVTVFCRQSSRTDALPSGVHCIRGDLSTGRGLADAVRDCDIVIHMAALLFGLKWQDYLEANCSCARSLARALQEAGSAGPERVVFVSSLACAGPCDSMSGRKEDDPGMPVSAYGWSKLLSENILRSALGEKLVIVRPPIIYGSGDKGLLPVYKGLALGLAAVPGISRDFPVSVAHVDDVAQAVALCCREDASGVYHLCDGHPLPMASFYQAAAKALNKKAFIVHLPLWLMGFTAFLSTAFGTLAAPFRNRNARMPNWNMDKYREARERGWVGSKQRITEELGFCPVRTLEDGMKETIEGNRRLGLLPKPKL